MGVCEVIQSPLSPLPLTHTPCLLLAYCTGRTGTYCSYPWYRCQRHTYRYTTHTHSKQTKTHVHNTYKGINLAVSINVRLLHYCRKLKTNANKKKLPFTVKSRVINLMSLIKSKRFAWLYSLQYWLITLCKYLLTHSPRGAQTHTGELSREPCSMKWSVVEECVLAQIRLCIPYHMRASTVSFSAPSTGARRSECNVGYLNNLTAELTCTHAHPQMHTDFDCCLLLRGGLQR